LFQTARRALNWNSRPGVVASVINDLSNRRILRCQRFGSRGNGNCFMPLAHHERKIETHVLPDFECDLASERGELRGFHLDGIISGREIDCVEQSFTIGVDRTSRTGIFGADCHVGRTNR